MRQVRQGDAQRRTTHAPGQSVCAGCNDKVNGLIIGGATGGLGGAVAGPGIMGWIRTSMSGRPKQ